MRVCVGVLVLVRVGVVPGGGDSVLVCVTVCVCVAVLVLVGVGVTSAGGVPVLVLVCVSLYTSLVSGWCFPDAVLVIAYCGLERFCFNHIFGLQKVC